MSIRNRRIFILSIFFIFCLGVIFTPFCNGAQSSFDMQEMLDRDLPPKKLPAVSDIVKCMEKDLNLTKKQSGQITAIFEEERAQMQSLKGDIKGLRERTKAKIAKVLTAEQYEQWQSRQSQHLGCAVSGADDRGNRAF